MQRLFVVARPKLSARGRIAAGLAIAGLLLVPVAAGAAERLFVQIPTFTGDATQRGFEGQIEARAVTISASAAAGKPVLAPVVITKAVDRTSPLLLDTFARAKVIPSMVVTATASIAAASQPVQRYTLGNARIVDYRVVDGVSGTATEQISFAVGSLTFDSLQYDPTTGRPSGTVTGAIVNP